MNSAVTRSTTSFGTAAPDSRNSKPLPSGILIFPFAFCHVSHNNDTVVITSVAVTAEGKEFNVEIVELMSGMEDRGWQARANCMGVDPDLFFPERGASTREAKEVCRGCVAREDCLEYALDNGEKFGIWGGMSERERRRLRRARAIERRAQAS
jgi:WhiB family redox-sensing transcriptional regulator